jgi:putative membrane protein
MIAKQTETSSDLKGLVSSGDVKADIPASFDNASQEKLDKLWDAKPADFASEYDPMRMRCRYSSVIRSPVTAQGLGRQDTSGAPAPIWPKP